MTETILAQATGRRHKRTLPVESGYWRQVVLRFFSLAVNAVWNKITAYVLSDREADLARLYFDGAMARAHRNAAGTRSGKPTR